MKRFIEGTDRTQTLLLPDCLDDYVDDVNPVPVVFSALLKHWGQLGPAEIPPKRRFAYRFFQWNADQMGIPFAMPPRHPYNPRFRHFDYALPPEGKSIM